MRENNERNICEFYPKEGEGCVCNCGSDVSGKFVCTKEYSLTCICAIQNRREECKGEK